MKHPRILLASLLLSLSIPLHVRAQTSQPADRWDYERYYVVLLNGQRAGYTLARERAAEGGRTETFHGMKVELRRGQTSIRMAITSVKTESADGGILRISKYRNMGLAPVRTTSVVNGDRREVETVQSGRTLRKTVAWNPKVVGEAGQRRRMIEQLKADGDKLVLPVFDDDYPGDGSSPSTITRQGWEEIRVLGKPVRALKVTEANPADPAPTTVWLDADFREVAGEMSLGPGLVFRFEACTADHAHRPIDGLIELFNSGLIHVEGDVGSTRTLRSIRVTMAYKQPLDQPVDLPQSDRLKTIESTREHLVLEIRRPDYPDAPAGGDAPLTDELKAYLQPTEEFDITDKAILDAAREAVEQATDPVARGRAICDWVDRRLTTKDLSVLSGTASEVLRARAGDCSEHAVLLVAMARASGIPARTVNGLVYVSGIGRERQVLGFHAWAQLYLHGQWVDFDAAVPGQPATAFRIATGYGTADGKDERGSLRSIAGLFANIRQATATQADHGDGE
ncbi:MAG: hypothetical protein BIFFINMI_01674 [Phycisphaerae bacterium]|nr:hypothetical protein [Phycisphaerae bacterium]